MAGTYLIALRDAESAGPPLRGSGLVLSPPEPHVMTVLEAPCSSDVLFPSDHMTALEVRRALREQQNRHSPFDFSSHRE